MLVNGASGSLGSSAVQLAGYFGADVTGVCSTANTELVKSLGADKVIDYTNQDFTRINEKFDIIYDTVGKSSFTKCKNILKEKGIYLSPVLKGQLIFQMLQTSASNKKAKFAASGLKSDDQLREMLAELVEIYKHGNLQTIIDREYPLEKTADAHFYIAGGHKIGNVVIRVIS